jgi:NADPH2:quinone reductase
LRVFAAGVNPVETYIRSGSYQHRPHLPYTPGTDAAGQVEAVGSGIADLSPGDRVFTSRTLTGSYAEYTLAQRDCVHLLPKRLSYAQGAAVGVPYAAAYRAIFQRGRARPGETVLVHGASGGVGVPALQLARSGGLCAIGSAGSERGLALVREQGALAVDHREPAHLRRVQEITHGRGPDIILEMLANVNLSSDLDAVAAGGRIVVVGSRGRIEIDPRAVMSRDAAIYGMSLWNATPADLASAYESIIDGLRDGVLSPVVGRELPLSEAALAHKAVMEPGSYAKIVLLP